MDAIEPQGFSPVRACDNVLRLIAELDLEVIRRVAAGHIGPKQFEKCLLEHCNRRRQYLRIRRIALEWEKRRYHVVRAEVIPAMATGSDTGAAPLSGHIPARQEHLGGPYNCRSTNNAKLSRQRKRALMGGHVKCSWCPDSDPQSATHHVVLFDDGAPQWSTPVIELYLCDRHKLKLAFNKVSDASLRTDRVRECALQEA